MRTYFDPYDVPQDWRDARRYLRDCTDTVLSASNYIGDGRPAGMVCSFIGQHRDSDALTRSNFRTALAELEGVSDAVTVRSTGHWAVGWCEAIYIPATRAAVEMVRDIHTALTDYPVLDESDWSDLEYEEGWEFFDTGGGRFDIVRELPTDVAEMLDDIDGTEIGDDLWQRAAVAYFEHGYGEDSWDTDGAAQAIVDGVADWQRLAAHNRATLNGAQRELFHGLVDRPDTPGQG